MSIHAGALMSLLRTDVPVTPDPDTAQRWLEDELSKQAYHQQESLWDVITRWLSERLGELFRGADGNVSLLSFVWIALLIALVLTIVFAIRRSGSFSRLQHTSATREVFTDDSRTAIELRAAAHTAAAAGDYGLATIERFRAVARSFEERAVIEDRPGRTAREVCSDAAPRFPSQGDDLQWAADTFDLLCYGDGIGRAESYTRMVALDEDLLRTTPLPAGSLRTGPHLAAPS